MLRRHGILDRWKHSNFQNFCTELSSQTFKYTLLTWAQNCVRDNMSYGGRTGRGLSPAIESLQQYMYFANFHITIMCLEDPGCFGDSSDSHEVFLPGDLAISRFLPDVSHFGRWLWPTSQRRTIKILIPTIEFIIVPYSSHRVNERFSTPTIQVLHAK